MMRLVTSVVLALNIAFLVGCSASVGPDSYLNTSSNNANKSTNAYHSFTSNSENYRSISTNRMMVGATVF
ncbi:hypothetical protein ACNVED_00340 [Legionella sp. D16C41]|uniref:hypothetical protein n=1 Tax=Legionella sp. D16C41 TaxID=3402688 RepID=UPI003AF9C9F9